MSGLMKGMVIKMVDFHGSNKKRSYFEGWYIKQQNEEHSMALIPAFHINDRGNTSASIQVIFDGNSHYIPFLGKEFCAAKDEFYVRMGKNLFCSKGMKIDIEYKEIKIKGNLCFTDFEEIEYNVMGPFSVFPMQCNHGIVSMIHSVDGSLQINGEKYPFSGGVGYIEKDFGRSFPSAYFWAQCSDWSGKRDCSLMVSAAIIPFGLLSFDGCICVICYHGKVYRLATYLGARIKKWSENELMICQGKWKLIVTRMDSVTGHGLRAPQAGSMQRLIKEHIACRARCVFMKREQVVFDFIRDNVSLESVGCKR